MVAAAAGLAVYLLQARDDGAVWGSPELETIGHEEISAQINNPSDGGSNAPSPVETPTNSTNGGPDIAVVAAASQEPGKIALSLNTPSSNQGRQFDGPQSITQNALQGAALTEEGENNQSDALVPTNDLSAAAVGQGAPSGLTSPGNQFAGSSGSPGTAGGGMPVTAPALPPGALSAPTGGNTGGPQINSTPVAHAPSAPQAVPSPTDVSALSTPTANPSGSSGPRAPLQLAPGGIPSTSPAAQTITPGATPANPITPLSTAPDGTTILPISGSSCGGANCASGNSWQFFDPPVAIGYDYVLKPTLVGQPLTFGITDIMVTTKVASGIYDLWLYDVLTGQYVNSSLFSGTGQPITITADPTADPSGAFDVVKFLLSLSRGEDRELGITNPYLGLTQFSIRGIDPNAGLNPDDPAAFITGLLFDGTINGNLFITPLAIDSQTHLPVDPPTVEVSIPEPASVALLLIGLAGLGFFGIRGRKTARL